ncbi:MAG: lipid-A-disaccharide synthase N-terminal domain-containing protein, partial [Muribaculaceae bacterium]|nr:lipid-A-disaccharide synthase N-terminal domain-containing protein [Muribaculaceae bacterium]
PPHLPTPLPRGRPPPPGLLKIILIAAPPVLLALTAGNAADAFDSFFRRDDLPMWLLVFGSVGNLILSLRFIYQWLYSRRAGESELPAGFWIFSLAGAAIVFVYGILRADVVLILGQSFGLLVYSRNLVIGRRAAAMCLLAAVGLSAQASTRIEFTLSDSDIYPGTTHDVIVTVPEAYSPDSAACLYVGLDGILCNAPAVIDSLIASGEMPVTIGVFVQPGVVRDAADNVLRYNRSNEFDATDGTFGRFLAEELLPAVEALTTEDGRPIVLSANPDDHMIFGLSSGGIAAFSAAWFYPGLFHRVFSGCGTFVPMRGGNDLQALVRKNEPKPLRVFLQDGFSDTWNPLFGSWYEANAMLGTALEFAGYDCSFDWQEGGHSVRRANEIFADVMRWMWRDYPAAIIPGKTQNDMLAPMLIEGETWQAAAPLDLGGTPSALYPDSTLAVRTEPDSNWLWQSLRDPATGRYTSDQRFYWLHSPDNEVLTVGGMTFDSNGNLWVVTSAGLQICDQNGRVRAILDLPPGLDASLSCIRIEADGTVRLNGHARRLNVRPATPGVRPPSQGQG